MPGPLEIILVLLVVLVLFGARKLPEVGRGLGEGIREFRRTGRELVRGAPRDAEEPDA